jgi:hypothetical protein
MQTIIKYYFLISLLLFSGQVAGQETVEHTLKLDKDGIKVYILSHKISGFNAFKAITYINASLDSVLAVMLDNDFYTEWVHACNKSFTIEKVSFYERYHYQALNIPFPFKDRDFVLHSVMQQNPSTKAVTIKTSAVLNYCITKHSAQCNEVKQSNLVRVSLSVGIFTLELHGNGTRITWEQYTDPGGNLPKWLVNQFVEDTPYWTLKKLAQKVTEDKYKYAKLIYNTKGVAVSLDIPTPEEEKEEEEATLLPKDFGPYPSF